ncbi:hypothetical protein PspLS_00980 [Pyricularia sp. CBS 133598]|nr:hypothetical protein PspLS_00980 [Pyricularia sp. CBS 133598]
MPAIMDDPDTPTIYRVSGEAPYPDPLNPSFPSTIVPRQVTLRDRQTVATIVPFASQHQVPLTLLQYLSDQFKKEIEGGDTYPMIEPLPFDRFAAYWFQNFGGIMLLGSINSAEEVIEGKDWARECLGSFYIKPNYPGRSSHVCNAGFLVTDASRNRGVGRLMGETYLDWAPKLGYTYSVFNLVYETNVASCKIWDGLGFKRIGRVKGCASLKSYPGQLIDAIIYGRDLVGQDGEDFVSEERFDKIKFYLKYGKYPNGADRAEKSRLRSAATHYKLLEDDRLMLKGKEVISDPRRQYEIAREVHVQQHGGINRTTASIAERYHWSRIKETVSDVIRNCTECKELGKTPSNSASSTSTGTASVVAAGVGSGAGGGFHNGVVLSEVPNNNTPLQRSTSNNGVTFSESHQSLLSARSGEPRTFLATALNAPSPPPDITTTNQYPPTSIPSSMTSSVNGVHEMMHQTSKSHQLTASTYAIPSTLAYADPASMTIMSPSEALHTSSTLPNTHSPMLQDQSHGNTLHSTYHHNGHHHHHHHHNETSHMSLTDYDQPIDPQIISQPSSHHHDPTHDPFAPFSPAHHHPDADPFQALLRQVNNGHSHSHQSQPEASPPTPQPPADESDRIDGDAVDRDMDMLIRQQDDDDDDELAVNAVGGMDVDLAGIGRVKPSLQKQSGDRHDDDVMDGHRTDGSGRYPAVTGAAREKEVYFSYDEG